MATQAFVEFKSAAPRNCVIGFSFLSELSLPKVSKVHPKRHLYKSLASLENRQKPLSWCNSRFGEKLTEWKVPAFVGVFPTHSASRRLFYTGDKLSPTVSCIGRKRSQNGLSENHIRLFSHSPLQENEGFRVPAGPNFQDFVRQAQGLTELSSETESQPSVEKSPKGRIYHETYGCQMNMNDMEIVLSIMKSAGYTDIVETPENAEIIFINTCAIRENAEQKVWQRLNYFWFLKREWKKNIEKGRAWSFFPPKVVVLGCMAERLKEKLIEADKMVDVVCGPDAYRDLPRLLEAVDYGQKGVNTLLSLEETYADISPVRIASNSVTAFVSIMRGCNNMCSYCIVPFTRGRERSRPVESIVKEVDEICHQGVKEVMLLGQNVNSYNDTSLLSEKDGVATGNVWSLSQGFSSICKVKNTGRRLSDLLDCLSAKYPEIRFRFTSPHPKDFPDDLLFLMKERSNICKSIHLPAQSGSTTLLERMRRGYTREAYIDLVERIRSIIPDTGLSSDFIAGFCGETEEEHEDTLSLIECVGYDMAYMFAYSMREKTHADRNYIDDVPDDIKQRRLSELINAFRKTTGQRYDSQIGSTQLVLVEGPNRRAPESELIGKSDRGHRVTFRNVPLQDVSGFPSYRIEVDGVGDRYRGNAFSLVTENGKRSPCIGDYVEVLIIKSSRATLFGEALGLTNLTSFYKKAEEIPK